MKQIKRNKSKVWRKCYGKPFLARRALRVMQMAATSAQAIALAGNIYSAHGNLAMKAVAVAECMVNFARAIGDASHQINKGFKS